MSRAGQPPAATFPHCCSQKQGDAEARNTQRRTFFSLAGNPLRQLF